MAVLRDAARLCVLEPFALWKLSKDEGQILRHANGVPKGGLNGQATSVDHAVRVNGNALENPRKKERRIRRSVLRFAEQGWPVIYYTVQWCHGLVSAVTFNVDVDSSGGLAVYAP
jgi:acyl-CoA-dependent ceramide synthase